MKMVFISAGSSHFGFVEARGKKYTFALRFSNTSSSNLQSQASISLDNRFYSDYEEHLQSFIERNNIFNDPEDFYKRFCEFVREKVEPPKKSKILYQNSSKISALCKNLALEIEDVEEFISDFDLQNYTVTVQISDFQMRIHKAIIKLSLNYKTDPIIVLSHNLPLQISGKSNSDLDNTYSISEFCNKFQELIKVFQSFWSTVDLIDSQCCVLDPSKPTLKDTYRRIMLSEAVSIVLTFNPFNVIQRPKINLVGRQSDVNQYLHILQNNLENDIWDDEEDLLFNLSNVLEASIPNKIFVEEPETSGLIESGECAICFTWQLQDKVPSEICENINCKSVYHSECLFTYFSSVPRNRDYFGKIQGECPNCNDIISCKVPKLC